MEIANKIEKIQAVEISPNDVILVTLKMALKPDQMKVLADMVADMFPKNKVFIKGDCYDVEIIRNKIIESGKK